MSASYELALRGLKSNEAYVEKISHFVNENIPIQLEKDEDGYILLSEMFNLFFDFKDMDLKGIATGYGFDADFTIDIIIYNNRITEAVELLLKLIVYLDSMNVKYLLIENSAEKFRKEGNELIVAPVNSNWESVFHEEIVSKFLK